MISHPRYSNILDLKLVSPVISSSARTSNALLNTNSCEMEPCYSAACMGNMMALSMHGKHDGPLHAWETWWPSPCIGNMMALSMHGKHDGLLHAWEIWWSSPWHGETWLPSPFPSSFRCYTVAEQLNTLWYRTLQCLVLPILVGTYYYRQ